MEITAVCDIRSEYADKAAAIVLAKTGRKVHDLWKYKHHCFDEKAPAEIKEKYSHPLYREAGDIAKKVGGHGGMDFLMDLRWAYCLQLGLPLDTDVYDLASWCAVSELSERSARNRSRTVDIPDFTGGLWRTPCNSNLMDATIGVWRNLFV